MLRDPNPERVISSFVVVIEVVMRSGDSVLRPGFRPNLNGFLRSENKD